MYALDKYLDLTVFNNSFRYIGIPRTATQSIKKYITSIDDKYKKLNSTNIEICVIRNPLDRLASALRHNKNHKTLSFDEIVEACQIDEHYLPFTKFDFFPMLNSKTILIPYNKNVIIDIKHIIEKQYNISLTDIEIPVINRTEKIRVFSCPYRSFINQNLKNFKKIYKEDIEFYQTIINSKKI
jgi:hypothetical protein